MNRTEKILAKVPRHGLGIEIGPGYNPLVPKAEGWNTLVVDHASQQELVKKYQAIGVDTSRIQTTDIVWHGGPLHEAVPPEQHGTFDYCVASHVIEHIPNPIEFLCSIAVLLKPGGVVSLAIPDKRYCFDFFQPLSSSADILVAHQRKARIHSNRAIFQHSAYAARTGDGLTAWGPNTRLGSHEFLNPDLQRTYERFLKVTDAPDAPYEDCHAWHFTPASFALIHLELSQLGLLPYRLEASYPTAGCEFFVTLGNTPPEVLDRETLNHTRLHLLRQIQEELSAPWLQLNPGLLQSIKGFLWTWAYGLLRRLRSPS